jgi:hypothetical protein
VCLFCIALLLHLLCFEPACSSRLHCIFSCFVLRYCSLITGALFFTHAYHPAAQVHNTSALHHVLYCIALHNTEYCSVWFTVLHYTTLQFTYCVTKNAHRDSIDYTLSNKEILFDSLFIFPIFLHSIPLHPFTTPFSSVLLYHALLDSALLFCSVLLHSALPPFSLLRSP